MICPRCNNPLASLLDPCPRCGLAFSDTRVPCRKCRLPMHMHGRPPCPTPKEDPIPCPLCGGKRHRKTPGSTYECLWRQWETQEFGGMPISHDNAAEEAFVKWRAAHPQLLAGSVHAERLIRQAKRAKSST